ncbi:MAG: hypothetical protein V2A76_14815 [Planctomycetota bacterium]
MADDAIEGAVGADPFGEPARGKTFVGQASSHFSHSTHSDFAGRTTQKLTKLNGARNAPIGQKSLQNPLLTKRATSKTSASTENFTRVAVVTAAPPIRFGRVTCNADAGQTRQNEKSVSSPKQYGSRKTINSSTRYFR